MTSEEVEDQHAAEGGRQAHSGNYAAALESFRAALEIARERGDRKAECIHLANCGSMNMALRRLSEAEGCFASALPLAAQTGLRKEELQLQRMIGVACLEQRKPETAKSHIEAALTIARDLGNRHMEPELTGCLGIAEMMMSRTAEALTYYQSALDSARELGLVEQTGVIVGNMGQAYLDAGDYEEAQRHFTEALRIARETGDAQAAEQWRMALDRSRAEATVLDDPAAMAARDYRAAVESSRGSVPRGRQLELWLAAARSCRMARDYSRCGDSLANAGMLLSELGRFDEADRKFDEAFDVIGPNADSRKVGLIQMNRGIAHAERGDHSRAVQFLEEAVLLLRRSASTRELAHAVRALARIHVKNGERAQATPLINELDQLARDGSSQIDPSDVLFLRAAIASHEDAEQAFREAIEAALLSGSTESLAGAAVGLAASLEERGQREEAARELRGVAAHLKANVAPDLALTLAMVLARLTGTNADDPHAMAAWTEAYKLAEAASDAVTTVRALGGIATILGTQIAAHRARLRPAGSLTDAGPLAGQIKDEDEAFELIRSILDAGPEQIPQLIHAHAARFNTIVFDSLAYNVGHALENGDRERASTLVSLAQMIVDLQNQALSIVNMLSTQLIDCDEDLIFHLAPGVRLTPKPDDPKYTRRAAEELARDGQRLMAGGLHDEATQRFENASELFATLDDLADVAECLGNMAFCSSESGRLEAALDNAGRAAEVFRDLGDRAGLAKSLIIAGSVLHKMERIDAAIQTYEQAAEAAREAERPDIEAAPVGNIGALLQERGEMQAALPWQERALELKRLHSDELACVSTLGNLTSLYEELGQHAKANEAKVEVRRILEHSGSRRHVAAFLNNQAKELMEQGRVGEAEAVFYQALEAAMQVGDASLEFHILTNMIVISRDLSRWNRVDNYLERADALQQRIGGAARRHAVLGLRADVANLRGRHGEVIAAADELLRDHWVSLLPSNRISLLHNLVQSCRALGRLEESAAWRERLTAEMDTVWSDPHSANDLQLYLLCTYAAATLAGQGEGDPQCALEHIKRAIELATVCGETRAITDLEEFRASLFRRTGRLVEAVTAHERALKQSKRTENRQQQAIILNNLGTALRELGRLQESASRFEEALELSRRTGLEGLEAQVMLKYAGVAFDLGRRELRRQLLRESYAIARKISDIPTTARALIAIAGEALSEGDAAAAEKRLAEIVEHETELPEDVLAEAFGVYALALYEQGRYEEALPYSDKCVSLRKCTAVEQATSLFYAGVIHLAANRLETALERFDGALQLAGEDVASPLTSNIYRFRGDIHLRLGDLEAAQNEYERGVEHSLLMRKYVPDERDRLGRLSDFASIGDKLTHVLLLRNRVVEAFNELEAGRSKTFVERLGLGELPIPDSVPPPLREREQQIRNTVRAAQQELLDKRASGEHARSEFTKLLDLYREVLDQIWAYAPAYAEWRRGTSLDYAGVRAMLNT